MIVKFNHHHHNQTLINTKTILEFRDFSKKIEMNLQPKSSSEIVCQPEIGYRMVTFTGDNQSVPAREWMYYYEHVCTYRNYTQAQRMVAMSHYLSDKIMKWYIGAIFKFTNFECLKRDFLETFVKKEEKWDWEGDDTDNEIKLNSAEESFMQKKARLAREAGISEEICCENMIAGLPTAYQKVLKTERRPLSYERFYKLVKIMWICDRFCKITQSEQTTKTHQQQKATTAVDQRGAFNSNTNQNKKFKIDPRWKRSSEGEAKICFFCDQPGHYVRDCPEKAVLSKQTGLTKRFNMADVSDISSETQVPSMTNVPQSDHKQQESHEFDGNQNLNFKKLFKFNSNF